MDKHHSHLLETPPQLRAHVTRPGPSPNLTGVALAGAGALGGAALFYTRSRKIKAGAKKDAEQAEEKAKLVKEAEAEEKAKLVKEAEAKEAKEAQMITVTLSGYPDSYLLRSSKKSTDLKGTRQRFTPECDKWDTDDSGVKYCYNECILSFISKRALKHITKSPNVSFKLHEVRQTEPKQTKYYDNLVALGRATRRRGKG